MKLNFVYTIIFQLFVVSVYAGEGEYAVSKIPAALLDKASAVKRYELVQFEIEDPGNAHYYYKRAITVLNEGGDEFSGMTESYDKFSSIKSINATLYDGDGKKIRSLKKSDISDLSGTGGMNLTDDVRYKRHDFFYKVYPYTVEYEVEITYNSLLFIPSWTPVEDEDFSVENSTFRITYPADYKIRYRSFQYNKEPLQAEDGKRKTQTWTLENFAAIKREYAAPDWQRITPTVMAGPTDFRIDDYKGNMSDWAAFGKFVYALKSDRDQLPANIAATVHELTDNIPDERKKIELLYNFMQQNTRYVSIQLGIGGWQPFDAASVAQKKYGDCKALTNYMYSLLKEAGIRSVYTIVKAGQNNRNMYEDFPAQQFNHVILSVPLKKDTVWLECTSQILPAGYLSNFTSNRYALMVDEDGGHLVKTPSYTYHDNVQVKKISAVVDETGKLTAEAITRYSGMQQDDIFMMINALSKKEQLEHLKKEINLPNYDIKSFEYHVIGSKIPAIDEKINLVADNYAQVSGRRLFIQPNLLSKSDFRPKEGERKYDIELMFEYTNIDSVEISIPGGYTVEAVPEQVNFSNKFGEYKISYKVEGNKIVLTRLFEKKSGRFPKTDYTQLVKMYNDMYKADRGKVVLVKKEV